MAANVNLGEIEDSDHDSWADDLPEEPERAARLNRVYAERAAFFQQRIANNNWCTCDGCWPLVHTNTHHDVSCCQESVQARASCQDNEHFGEKQPYTCITRHPTFRGTCLYDRFLLGLEHNYHVDGVDTGRLPRNERLRYVAYRCYTSWIHGHLGRWNRLEIPQCVTAAIRRQFPDEAEQYVGCQEADRQ